MFAREVPLREPRQHAVANRCEIEMHQHDPRERAPAFSTAHAATVDEQQRRYIADEWTGHVWRRSRLEIALSLLQSLVNHLERGRPRHPLLAVIEEPSFFIAADHIRGDHEIGMR